MSSSRELDIIVYGVTGFTGRRVFEYLLNIKEAAHLKLGVAGRKGSRVAKILQQEDAENRVELLAADAGKPAELLALAQKTRLFLNCVGPYRYSGDAVVRACVEAGTDYLDVSGEPEFIEAVEFKYRAKAKDSYCFIASACGFDSVVADFGTLYMQRKFHPSGVPSSVESFLSFHTEAKSFRFNYATWESAVHGFASAEKLRDLRRQSKESGFGLPAPKFAGPRLRPPAGAVYDARVNAYAIPFPGSDASVVSRTQRWLYSKGQAPVQYAASFCISSRWSIFLLAVYGMMFRILAAYSWGRHLLLNFPSIFSAGVFSKQGPSQTQLELTSFSMFFIGSGYQSAEKAAGRKKPDREIRMKILGPEPGYVATPIFLVQAALTLLDERKAIEATVGPGGVFTAAALLERLSREE